MKYGQVYIHLVSTHSTQLHLRNTSDSSSFSVPRDCCGLGISPLCERKMRSAGPEMTASC